MSFRNLQIRADFVRQISTLMATPLIWLFSSLGLFLSGARSPSEFSGLSVNLLVPQTVAFTIWGPIFMGIFAYGVIQALPKNRTRVVFQDSGWWISAGLWGVAGWGLITAYVSDDYVELFASLIFLPAMVSLVIGMSRLWRNRSTLTPVETWLALVPVSLIAGWCSIAFFVGLNGVVWRYTEPLGWNIQPVALSILALSLLWAVFVIRKLAINKLYSFPILWGLVFLALRHFSVEGDRYIAIAAIAGLLFLILAVTIRGKSYTDRQDKEAH